MKKEAETKTDDYNKENQETVIDEENKESKQEAGIEENEEVKAGQNNKKSEENQANDEDRGGKETKASQADKETSITETNTACEQAQTVDKPIRKYKTMIVSIFAVICTLFVFYLGTAVYFMNHFYFGTEINGMSVSGKSQEEAKRIIADELKNYTLTLKERGGNCEVIKASDVGLEYDSDDTFKKLNEGRNPFMWGLVCLNIKDFKITTGVTYDEKLLQKRVEQLACLDSKNIIEPKNPSFHFKANYYVLVPEIIGNKADKDILSACIKEALLKKQPELDLEEINSYIKPQYDLNNQKVIKAEEMLNRYISPITYTFQGNKEVLEAAQISQWLKVDKDYNIFIDKAKAEEYIDLLLKKYHTSVITRSFRAASGKITKVSGGDYGLDINKLEEAQRVIKAIKGKQKVISESGSMINETYVEIDMTKQHLWFYKNGLLIIQGDVVTGNLRTHHATPKGVYRLKAKVKNAVLRGPGYAAPVNYWMPFNGGIGIHDASWKSVFGGTIYKTNGSHGCINCPNSLAAAIYKEIEIGTPVICY